MGTIDFLGLLTMVIILAGFGLGVYMMIRQGPTAWPVLATNGVVILVVGLLFYAAAPYWANWLLYQVFWLHSPHLVALFLGTAIAAYAAHLILEEDRLALGVIYGAAAVIVGFGGCFVITVLNDARVAAVYTYTPRDSLVQVRGESLRWAPMEVALNDLNDGFTSAEFTVDLEHTDAIPYRDGFAYVTPIIPDGAVMSFQQMNDGFMVYDDRPGISDNDRVRRIRQPFKYGEEMLLFDNILRQLYYTDRWAIYQDLYELNLNPENPDEFVIVVPKIKFDYQFPIYFVPYWAGVELVYPDGSIEDLTVDEALADTRLQGQLIQPIKLARYVVACQKYDEGWLSGLYRRPGKIEVPVLPGYNQMPYLTPGADGNWYFVTLAEPSGGSDALFRAYFWNAYSGERTVFHWAEGVAGVLGPEIALQRVKELPGYRWVEEGVDGEEGGNFRVLESVYVTRANEPDNVYYKYTITTKKKRGIAATVVVDGARRTIRKFTSRQEFILWVNGHDTGSVSGLPESKDNNPLSRARAIYDELSRIRDYVGLLVADLEAVVEQ